MYDWAANGWPSEADWIAAGRPERPWTPDDFFNQGSGGGGEFAGLTPTQVIAAYRAGRITQAQLTAELSARGYTPAAISEVVASNPLDEGVQGEAAPGLGGAIAQGIGQTVQNVVQGAQDIATQATRRIPPDTSIAGAVNGSQTGAWSPEEAYQYLIVNGLNPDQARAAFTQRGYAPPGPGGGAGGGGGAPPIPGYDPQAVATLYDAASRAGFTGDALNRAVATALAESGGRFDAENRSAMGVPENSMGAWQINLDAHADKVPGATFEEKAAWLKDPYNAAQIAFQVSSGGTDFSPWSVWRADAGKPAEALYTALSASGGGGGLVLAAGQSAEQRFAEEQLLADFRAGKITEAEYNARREQLAQAASGQRFAKEQILDDFRAGRITEAEYNARLAELARSMRVPTAADRTKAIAESATFADGARTATVGGQPFTLTPTQAAELAMMRPAERSRALYELTGKVLTLAEEVALLGTSSVGGSGADIGGTPTPTGPDYQTLLAARQRQLQALGRPPDAAAFDAAAFVEANRIGDRNYYAQPRAEGLSRAQGDTQALLAAGYTLDEGTGKFSVNTGSTSGGPQQSRELSQSEAAARARQLAGGGGGNASAMVARAQGAADGVFGDEGGGYFFSLGGQRHGPFSTMQQALLAYNAAKSQSQTPASYPDPAMASSALELLRQQRGYAGGGKFTTKGPALVVGMDGKVEAVVGEGIDRAGRYIRETLAARPKAGRNEVRVMPHKDRSYGIGLSLPGVPGFAPPAASQPQAALPSLLASLPGLPLRRDRDVAPQLDAAAGQAQAAIDERVDRIIEPYRQARSFFGDRRDREVQVSPETALKRQIFTASMDPADLINVARMRRQREVNDYKYELAGLPAPTPLSLPKRPEGQLPPGMFMQPLTLAEYLEAFELPRVQLGIKTPEEEAEAKRLRDMGPFQRILQGIRG